MLQQSTNMQAQAPQRMVYTVSEAAEILSVSNGTVYNLIKEGQFKALRIGYSIRIPKKSFEEWLYAANN